MVIDIHFHIFQSNSIQSIKESLILRRVETENMDVIVLQK